MPEQLAVIFDVDGVLVDSYQAHFTSWKRLGAAHDFSPTEADFARDFGRTSREILTELGRGWSDDEIDRLDDEKESLYRQIIAGNFPEMAGARQLIDRLAAAGYRLAVGSSGPRENVLLTLDKLDRAAIFQAVITGSDVRRGKPDPEVFLLAAERLEVPPHACAVIEDAAPGVAAANAAGMVAIGLVSQGRTVEELQAADQIVERLDALNPAGIGQLIARGRGR